jgi:rhodanese-related sulfurtransferase
MFGSTFMTWKKNACETHRAVGLRSVGVQLRWDGGFVLLCALALLLAGGFGCGAQESLTWSNVFADIARQYPQVPQMNGDELQRRMALPEQQPAVIDVRARKEYDVSHLAGAVWAESARDIRKIVSELPPQETVVLYCSVGVRSSAAAQKLLEAGRTNVFNLKGSIFQWANEGRTVVSNGVPTAAVHPYNKRWGRLLDPSHHPQSP